jgi:hypothetical protein
MNMTYIDPRWTNKELDNVIRYRLWWILHYLELTYDIKD